MFQSQVLLPNMSGKIDYIGDAVKAVASGGATLAMDAKNIAIDAGKSLGGMVMKGEDSDNEGKEKKDSNAFRGESRPSNQPQNHI